MKTTSEFIESLGSADFQSWLLVQEAYRKWAFKEPISECGYNMHNGNVYIALENGICIASCFGEPVEYIITDFETGEESFFDTYQDATENI